MLSRKHYKKIANIIDITNGNANLGDDATEILANNLADYFKEDNPNFDRSRFLEACGVEEWINIEVFVDD